MVSVILASELKFDVRGPRIIVASILFVSGERHIDIASESRSISFWNIHGASTGRISGHGLQIGAKMEVQKMACASNRSRERTTRQVWQWQERPEMALDALARAVERAAGEQCGRGYSRCMRARERLERDTTSGVWLHGGWRLQRWCL